MAVQDAGGSDDDNPSNKSLYLAKCVQKSSVVVHAVSGHLRSPITLDLVFGKETALELVVLAADGSVQSICEQPVFGSIKDLKVLPWNEAHRAPELETFGKDLLVLLSDSGKLSFLMFSIEFHRFLAVSHIQLSSPGNSLDELGWLLAIESRGCAVAVAAFQDQVAIFPTSASAGRSVVDKSIDYLGEPLTTVSENPGTGNTIWSMSFVSGHEGSNTLTLAVLLHRAGAVGNELQLLLCDLNERSIYPRACLMNPDEPSAGFLAFGIGGIPSLPGFLLLFRPGELLLVDTTGACASTVTSVSNNLKIHSFEGEDPRTDDTIKNGDCVGGILPFVCSWSLEPDGEDEQRLVIGLNTGEIFIASLTGRAAIVLSECQYKCSPCKVLLWIRGGFIAAIVEMGDGHVLKVEKDTLTRQSCIQNIAPILDFSLVDYHGEKQDQMFACCGAWGEGSLRVIRNGVSVEKLLSTPPIYHGVTGTWTIRIRQNDPYHVFLIISFVEETRVLSVGLNFVDITEAVGFISSSSTLACGLVQDGWISQVCSREVRLCSPTKAANASGVETDLPITTTWKPQGFWICLGAVAAGKIVLALSRPGLLLMLGTHLSLDGKLELVELQHCLLEAEVSCISIPEEIDQASYSVPLEGNDVTFPSGIKIGNVCVVGTHKPSVELLSITPGEKFLPLAVGQVSFTSTIGTTISGCIPQDVKLALFDRLYILTGLRNGMLLRFEWPDSCCFGEPSSLSPTPVQLHLIASRRIGVSPVFLVQLQASLRSDIIALSDRPWLLQTARHSQRIAYSSISFQPSTHVTPVCSPECPKGILFVAECSLHLVEMEHSKRLNVQKLPLLSTGRRVLYHKESKMLLVMRSEGIHEGRYFTSDLSCVDPLSGALHSCLTFGRGEAAKCMQLMKVGDSQILIVGTSHTTERSIMPTGEAESSKGNLLVILLEPKSNKAPESSSDRSADDGHKLTEIEEWQLSFKSTVCLPGTVLAVSPYLDQYVLASAGNSLFCLGFSSEVPLRLRRLTSVKTRFLITSIAVHLTRIAVGDCRDGILLYTFREDTKKLEQLQCDPMQRLVADCVMVDLDTAVVMDRKGNFCALSCPRGIEDNPSPERNLTVSCWFHLGEISLSIRKGSFAYKLSFEDAWSSKRLAYNFVDTSVVASTVLGSVFIFIRVTREEYNLLEAVQTKLALYPLTAPVLGNNHARFRGQGCPAGVKKALDGDMLSQFLELTSAQQVAVLKEQPGIAGGETSMPKHHQANLPIEHVLRLLERVHHALT